MLAAGLPEESRIARAISGRQASGRDILLALAVDRLGDVLCMLSRGKVHPPSLAAGLVGQSEPETVGFDSAEDFAAAWEKVNGNGD